MVSDIITLRGAVISKYKTIGNFANAIHWKRTKASRIINGIQSPDVLEIQALADCLNITDSATFMLIFFAPLSTKWTFNTN